MRVLYTIKGEEDDPRVRTITTTTSVKQFLATIKCEKYSLEFNKKIMKDNDRLGDI